MATIAGANVECVIDSVNAECLEGITTPESLREAFSELSYVAHLPGLEHMPFTVWHTRLKGHYPLSKSVREMWIGSRALFNSKIAMRARSATETARTRKIDIHPKDKEVLLKFGRSIERLKEKKNNPYRIQSGNMRAIHEMRKIVEDESLKDSPSSDQLKNCAGYLTLLAVTCDLSPLEQDAMVSVNEMIKSLLGGAYDNKHDAAE